MATFRASSQYHHPAPISFDHDRPLPAGDEYDHPLFSRSQMREFDEVNEAYAAAIPNPRELAMARLEGRIGPVRTSNTLNRNGRSETWLSTVEEPTAETGSSQIGATFLGYSPREMRQRNTLYHHRDSAPDMAGSSLADISSGSFQSPGNHSVILPVNGFLPTSTGVTSSNSIAFPTSTSDSHEGQGVAPWMTATGAAQAEVINIDHMMNGTTMTDTEIQSAPQMNLSTFPMLLQSEAPYV